MLRFLDVAGIQKRDARMNPNKGQPGTKRLEREEAKKTAAEEKVKAAAEARRPPRRPPPKRRRAAAGQEPVAEDQLPSPLPRLRPRPSARQRIALADDKIACCSARSGRRKD